MSTGVRKITPEEAARCAELSAKHGYIVRVLIALDMFLNVALLRGRVDETISSHAARAAIQSKRWGIIISKLLNAIARNHGAGAIVGDMVRAESIAQTEAECGVVMSDPAPQ